MTVCCVGARSVVYSSSLYRKNPIEDDTSLSLKEKRHSRVKSWTKKVDIFEKDYLVIPINERNHWFLAIVCFPGLSGPISVKDNKPVKAIFETVAKKTSEGRSRLVTLNGESFHIGNTTITPISSNSKVISLLGRFLISIFLDDKSKSSTVFFFVPTLVGRKRPSYAYH